MLKISTDGRKAALDVRLVLPATPSGPSREKKRPCLLRSVRIAPRVLPIKSVISVAPIAKAYRTPSNNKLTLAIGRSFIKKLQLGFNMPDTDQMAQI